MQITGWIVIAVLSLLLFGIFAQGKRKPAPKAPPRKRQIAVDGTNVLFWRGEVARVATLKKVLKHLRAEGFDPVVFLDASARHHVKDPSLNRRRFADVLGLARNRVTVVPAGTEADAAVLEYARAHKVSVVSNDNFRDRPNAARNIKLVKGRFEGHKLVLKNL